MANTQTQPSAPNGIPVAFDDGTQAYVPQEKLSDAIKDGGKLVQSMTFDDGTKAWVPFDKVHDAIHDGGQLTPPPLTVGAPQNQPMTQVDAAGNPIQAPQFMGAPSAPDWAVPGNNAVTDTVAGFAKGFVKGAGQTIAPGPRRAAQINAATGLNVPSTADPGLQTQGTAEGIGSGFEGVGEFILGDEALKGLSLAERAGLLTRVAKLAESHPVIAKALQVGMNAVRTGAVGTVQGLAHGESLPEAATTGAVTGATSGAIEGTTGAVKDLAKALTPAVSDATAKGSQLAEDLAGKPLSDSTQVAKNVSGNIADAEKAMHTTYESGMSAVSQAAKDVPVDLEGSKLQDTAKQLRGNGTLPANFQKALKGIVPDAAKLNPLLDEFSKGGQMSWDDVEGVRKDIGAKIRKLPLDSPNRGDLIQLRSAIDSTLEDSAEAAGKPEVADQIRDVRQQYATTKAQLETDAIKKLADKNPDSVARVLINGESAHNVSTLRNVIGADNMKAVEGSVFQDLLTRSSDPQSKIINPKTLARNWGAVPDATKQALWGDRLPQVQSFINAASKPASNFAGNTMTAAKLATTGYGLWKLYQGDYKGAGEAALLLSGTRIPLKTLTNPDTLSAVTKAMEAAGKGRQVGSAVASQAMRAVMQGAGPVLGSDNK